MALPFDSEYPYPSQRMPVLAGRCVATSQPLAAQAGLDIMRRGGNAVDAAVATAAALTVVEPTSNGLGSDAFALVWTGGGLHGLNASGRSPKRLDGSKFDNLDEIARHGWDGVTVPGAVSGWVECHRAFGRLAFERVLEPAIRYAAEGFLVSPMTATSWGHAFKAYDTEQFAAWHQTFAPDGRAPEAGERFKMPDHARTLEQIAESGGKAFYQGELAKAIASAAKQAGAPMRADDLAGHTADWVRPMHIDYRGLRLNEIPPNGQGLAALIALGILARFDVSAVPVDSAQSLHLQIEAMKLAFADADRYIADPAHMDIDADALLEDAYLDERAKRIDPDKAQDFGHGTPKPGGTVLLTAADDEGQMVSFIQSNYTGFGSGIVVPGTGIALQNRGCCFTTQAGHPNRVGPGKRPYHTIIPGFVTRLDADGVEQPVMAFGVMGGFMQPQGHAQVMVRLADYQQNPQAALDAPRWQVTKDKRVTIEPGYEPAVYEKLLAMGHEVHRPAKLTVSHGRGQCIYRLEDGYFAASDPRSDGQAVGY